MITVVKATSIALMILLGLTIFVAGAEAKHIAEVFVTNFPLDDQGNIRVTQMNGQNVSVNCEHNITVNWPTSTDITVWFYQHMSPSTTEVSREYKAHGFGKLHILIHSKGFDEPESLTLQVLAPLWDPTDTGYRPVIVYSIDLNSTSFDANPTIPVPSESFYFVAKTSPITECSICLSFYLTWA